MPIGVIVSCVSLHWINSWLMHVPRSFFGRRHNLWCRICSNQPLDNNVVLPKNYKCTCCCVVPRPLAIQIHDATAHSFNSFPSAGQCNAMRQQPAQPNQYLLLRPGRREWGGLTMHIFAKSLCDCCCIMGDWWQRHQQWSHGSLWQMHVHKYMPLLI